MHLNIFKINITFRRKHISITPIDFQVLLLVILSKNLQITPLRSTVLLIQLWPTPFRSLVLSHAICSAWNDFPCSFPGQLPGPLRCQLSHFLGEDLMPSLLSWSSSMTHDRPPPFSHLWHLVWSPCNL